MKIRVKKYCILFVFLTTHCSFSDTNFDEYSPKNVQKLSQLTYIMGGIATASFFCYHLVKNKQASRVIGEYLQKNIKIFDMKRSFTKTFDQIARSPEFFTWAFIHTIFKA